MNAITLIVLVSLGQYGVDDLDRRLGYNEQTIWLRSIDRNQKEMLARTKAAVVPTTPRSEFTPTSDFPYKMYFAPAGILFVASVVFMAIGPKSKPKTDKSDLA